MTDAHNLRVLSDADAAADLAGLPRPVGQMAKIMALVDHYGSAIMLHDFAEMKRARAAVEAALRDAPQAEPCFCDRNNLGEPGVSCGDCPTRDYKKPPSAPTAVEPLFAGVIAQHPGLREEIAAESERADFEAAYRARYPVSCDLDPAKFNRSDVGDYEDIRVSIAWAMWQARASKGTP